MKVLIIDDERHSRETSKMFLQQLKHSFDQIDMAANAKEAIEKIETMHPDLLLLDIQMPDMSGIEMLDKIPEYAGEIIFVTAYDQYAIEAFKKGALHYILKPIDIDDLEQAVTRASKNINDKELKRAGSWLSLSTMEGWTVIKKEDILRCESFKNYTTIYCKASKTTISKTLKDVEKKLPSSMFYRVHNSHIVNINFIAKILKSDGGRIVLTDQQEIPISKQKKQGFLQWFEERMDKL